MSADAAQGVFENLGERPVVAASPLPELRADVLAPDYTEAGRLAGRLMLNRAGHDMVYVYEAGTPGADQCRAGFEEVARSAGLNIGEAIIDVPARSAGGDRFSKLRGRFERIRGIAASTDFLALDLMLASCAAGRLAGRQVAIMGQGNELAGALVTPALTTIDFSGEEIGSRAMDLALQRVAKVRQDAPQQTSVPPVVVERESTNLS